MPPLIWYAREFFVTWQLVFPLRPNLLVRLDHLLQLANVSAAELSNLKEQVNQITESLSLSENRGGNWYSTNLASILVELEGGHALDSTGSCGFLHRKKNRAVRCGEQRAGAVPTSQNEVKTKLTDVPRSRRHRPSRRRSQCTSRTS